MIKKLDIYVFRLFLGPFLVVFGILFFIFVLQFAWQELRHIIGKGLDLFSILKLLFFLGINVVQLVLPLSILLASIMTFGTLGERYELASIKSTGISLWRSMRSVFIFCVLLTIGLYFFGDRMMPYSQKKARNMMYNIAKSSPTLNMREGVFVSNIPGWSMKINKIYGDDGEFLEDVFIHNNPEENNSVQSIIAKSGYMAATSDERLLRLKLYDGFLYVDENTGTSFSNRIRQPNQVIKFDTLDQYIDVSEVIAKAIEEETISEHYKFMNTLELGERIDSLDSLYQEDFKKTAHLSFTKVISQPEKVSDFEDTEPELTYDFDDLADLKKVQSIQNAINSLNNQKRESEIQAQSVKDRMKWMSKHVLHQQRNMAYALTVMVFLLVGAPLGAIVKKGGIGVPVLVAIFIFLIFYIVNYTAENLAKSVVMNPYWSAWLAVIVLFPVGIWLTYKANEDSPALEMDKITRLFSKIIPKFAKKNKKKEEHNRYQ